MLRKLVLMLLALFISSAGCSSGSAATDLPDGPSSDDPSSGSDSDEAPELRVLQLNIWMDATSVPDAFEGLVEEIARLDVDLVALCEVTDRSGSTADRLVTALQGRGQTWYGAGGAYRGTQGSDVCVLSRYPFKEIRYGLSSINGGVDMKVRIDFEGYDVVLYPSHLDYTHYACYLPRGYDGVSWQKLSAPVTDLSAIMQMNRASTRDEAIEEFLEEVSQEKADLILLSGDFNEPSHLDWSAATSALWDHRGCIVPWDCSVLLYDAGFRDVYRALYPDPVTHPGFTYPSDNSKKEPHELTWAPDADERDRIDFIYYMTNGRFVPTEAAVLGPSTSIVRNMRVREIGEDTFIEPLPDGTWPTDHKGVVATFRLSAR